MSSSQKFLLKFHKYIINRNKQGQILNLTKQTRKRKCDTGKLDKRNLDKGNGNKTGLLIGSYRLLKGN